MQKLELKDYYKTSDLALATTLSLHYTIDVLDKQNPHKALFLFKKEDSLDKLLEAYWKRELKVEPQTYFNQLKAIKHRLYSEI